MRILQRAFRVYSDPDRLERTVAFYEGLQGARCERRVAIPESGIAAAKVGAFLILSGEPEKLAYARQVQGIFYLDRLDAFEPWLRDHGAEILHEPRTVTGGRNLTVRHPDGLVIEYFEARS